MNSVLTLKCLLKSNRKRLKCHLYNGVTGCFSSWGGRNDALSLFPETQSHLSFGFKTIFRDSLARKDLFCHFDITLNFDNKRVWLEVHFDLHFWHPALASLCLSIVFHLHIITLLRFKVKIETEWKCVSFWRGAVKRSVAKIKILDPTKLEESKK